MAINNHLQQNCGAPDSRRRGCFGENHTSVAASVGDAIAEGLKARGFAVVQAGAGLYIYIASGGGFRG